MASMFSKCFPIGLRSVNALSRSKLRRNASVLQQAQRTTAAQSGGRLELIMGPMFAGKTSALISRIEEEECREVPVLVVKSAADDRYANDKVVTHDGASKRCIAVPALKDLPESELKEVNVIAIDESQFFPDLFEFCKASADRGQTVIVAGLDGDFNRERFGQIIDLIPLADRIQKLNARCRICGAEAPFTGRIKKSEEQTLVGGADAYMPLCRRHYLEHIIGS